MSRSGVVGDGSDDPATRTPHGPVGTTRDRSPFPFTGGRIDQVIVDVSGEPDVDAEDVDLEMEAAAMMHHV